MTTLGSFFGLGMTGSEIYHNFRDGTGDDGRGLYQAAYVVAGIADNYQRRGDSIKDLVGQMESAWQGNAAGAAQRGAGPLAVEHGLASPEITTAREALTNQVNVFSGAQGAVVEVPPEPQEPGIWDNITTLGGASQDYQTAKAYYDAANDHNVSVMEVYEGETETNTSSMPTTYGSITPDYSGIGVRDRTGPNQPLPWIPPDDPGTPNPGGRDPNYNNNSNNFANTNNNQSQNLTTNPNQNQTTLPNNDGGGGGGGLTVPADRPGNDPRFPPGPIGPGPGPGPGNPNNPNNMHPPGFVPGGGPFGPNGGDNARSGSGYGRGGGFGPGGSGGSGSGGSGSGGPGSGGRGGMGGGAMPGAAAAAGPAAAGMRGGGGMMGGGGMGGGGRRQDGDDDTEHERPSFLVEPDPHDTFGTDEVTAPPVIGE